MEIISYSHSTFSRIINQFYAQNIRIVTSYHISFSIVFFFRLFVVVVVVVFLSLKHSINSQQSFNPHFTKLNSCLQPQHDKQSSLKDIVHSTQKQFVITVIKSNCVIVRPYTPYMYPSVCWLPPKGWIKECVTGADDLPHHREMYPCSCGQVQLTIVTIWSWNRHR